MQDLTNKFAKGDTVYFAHEWAIRNPDKKGDIKWGVMVHKFEVEKYCDYPQRKKYKLKNDRLCNVYAEPSRIDKTVLSAINSQKEDLCKLTKTTPVRLAWLKETTTYGDLSIEPQI